MQGQEGTCTTIAAPAPTTSLGGLLLAMGLLVAIAAFALARRQRVAQ